METIEIRLTKPVPNNGELHLFVELVDGRIMLLKPTGEDMNVHRDELYVEVPDIRIKGIYAQIKFESKVGDECYKTWDIGRQRFSLLPIKINGGIR